MKKLAIIGSRSFTNYGLAIQIFQDYFIDKVDTIVSGGAVGADAVGRRISKDYLLKYIEFLPDYKQFGKSAPLKRNIDIVNTADYLLALWDGKSTGTKHTLGLAKQQKKPTFIVYF